MQKIHIIKICLCIICSVVYSQTEYTLKTSEKRIEFLVDTIKDNLSGTDVLDKFIKEQQAWLDYRSAHIETVFPESINNVTMEWGSILSYEIGQEILNMNLDRIHVLESYLNRNTETGTDGSGEFKEYVEELNSVKKK